jgi:autotransporter-associated beta strand protein
VPGPQPSPPPASDTPWNNATHANDIAVFGGNPGSGIVTLAGPISAGGFQFDNSGYNIQGSFIGLSAPPGRTSTIDTGANNATISSTIVGNGFTKIGTGTLALTGTNNYTGTTTINAGTLLVNNAGGSGTGNSGVMVNNSGCVLGGTGAIAGPVNVNSSAAVLGGNGATASGALTIANSLNLNPGSMIELALGAAGAHSVLNRAAGNWTFAPNQAFTFINRGAQPGFYDNIITGLAADPGGVASWMITSPGFAGSFFYDGAGHIDLNITAAPPVLQLTAAVSRKMHGGVGTFDVPLPLSSPFGVECRGGGSNGDHTLVFTFSNPVTSGSANVATMGTGSVSGSPLFSGNTMTVNLTDITDVQLITVTLSGVTDSFAQVLPDTAVSAEILLGDTNGNSSVNAGDVAQTKAQSGNVTGAGNFRNDTNATGSINAGDVGQVKANSGHSLP